MKPVVLVGHRHLCPLHGEGTVISGAGSAAVNGRAIARIGDELSCGAVIETGAAHTLIEGSPAARQGDKTSHGGTLIEGDPAWLIE
ncbi:PAAR domain-containing protein [Pseudomonas mosselii]|uniref:PAAR domain-containing protein n=1 Tax=unclassified Pseudomonas TaxID=196821 RepID=UPI0020C313A8|nr:MULTISPECIES: PAAR domain-containing protein [unclassified Pseudomonas]MCP8636477.1 PAAR domain-containing protein [Pseudomonas sp. DVZ6]MDD7787207.1 PAAR domain-containing protein [Pseudomonas sp. DVZ24]